MSGSATLTMVMSTALMTIAAETTASPRQRDAGSHPWACRGSAIGRT